MSAEAPTYVCPVCGQHLQQVFYDGDNWLLVTDDDFVPCFLDDRGTLAAILMGDGPYDPVKVVNIHSHYLSKSSFLLWLAIFAAAAVALTVDGLLYQRDSR